MLFLEISPNTQTNEILASGARRRRREQLCDDILIPLGSRSGNNFNYDDNFISITIYEALGKAAQYKHRENGAGKNIQQATFQPNEESQLANTAYVGDIRID